MLMKAEYKKKHTHLWVFVEPNYLTRRYQNLHAILNTDVYECFFCKKREVFSLK